MLKSAKLVFKAPDMRLVQGWSFSGKNGGREVEFYVIEKRREDSLGGECWDTIETFEKPRGPRGVPVQDAASRVLLTPSGDRPPSPPGGDRLT